MPQPTLPTDSHPIMPAVASIEALPSELLFYLSRYLDLATLIVFGTATSRVLRNTFAQFGRELLFLEPVHRLNLAEWREAARQIDQTGLTPASCVLGASTESAMKGELKGQEALNETVHQLTRDESLIDLHLLQSVLAFLAGQFSQAPLCSNAHPKGTASHSSGVNQIRCLHLTGWHGIAGAFLIQQLRMQPLLSQVCTVVKTDRADSRIWEQAAADDRQMQNRMRSASHGWTAQHHCEAVPHWLGQSGSTEDSALGFRQCTPTQIIVQVGKRRPRHPERPYLRGEGLQMGYQGYCIDVAADVRDDQVVAATDALTLDAAAVSGASTGSGPEPSRAAGTASANGTVINAASHKKLHVILQGREVEDGNQNEEMFERSIVSCNHCKERILERTFFEPMPFWVRFPKDGVVLVRHGVFG
ncbi:conserved hypothetical protein [Sporisorium reilianum SRZ2]|uniref:F-box domain-containing protein n=1 Tax=Sporisorium reilianum (strain SRZ2) TaxID=999809 RepID=E6ZK65_SPORE|nr:conserved hypothetical protein [Sporisorium reilianum SRZ2]